MQFLEMEDAFQRSAHSQSETPAEPGVYTGAWIPAPALYLDKTRTPFSNSKARTNENYLQELNFDFSIYAFFPLVQGEWQDLSVFWITDFPEAAAQP